jgi:hypothetical protein
VIPEIAAEGVTRLVVVIVGVEDAERGGVHAVLHHSQKCMISYDMNPDEKREEGR